MPLPWRENFRSHPEFLRNAEERMRLFFPAYFRWIRQSPEFFFHVSPLHHLKTTSSISLIGQRTKTIPREECHSLGLPVQQQRQEEEDKHIWNDSEIDDQLSHELRSSCQKGRGNTFHTQPHYCPPTAPEKPDLVDLSWDKETQRVLSMSRDS